MTSQITFYMSLVLGRKFVSAKGTSLGRIKDLLIDLAPMGQTVIRPIRPRVIAARVMVNNTERLYDFSSFRITRVKGNLRIVCEDVEEVSTTYMSNVLWLRESILDKQIVDINGKKLVRVNDIRLIVIPSGTYALAVDVGFEGLFRRLGVEKIITMISNTLKIDFPDRLILWDDIEAVDFSNASIKLSKETSKLNTLHPSDLADIIEELDKATRASLFASLDEEQAADVLEELEPEAQIHLVESLPKEKVADVLEKMPADEVADILDELEDEKAEEILAEMDKESREEVRELLEYPDTEVGSIMTTDFITFPDELTVEETLAELRRLKPEPVNLYTIFVIDRNERLLSSIPLGDLVISDPNLRLRDVVRAKPISVFDDDKKDSLAELVSKYNLLAVPVINREMKMEGMVVVEDIVEDLLKKRKTK